MTDPELDTILADMRVASAHMDEVNGTSEFPRAAIALALLARHYLRTLDELEARR